VAPFLVTKKQQSNGGHLEAGVAAKIGTTCSGIVEWWVGVAGEEIRWPSSRMWWQSSGKKLVVGMGARVQCIVELHTSVQPYKARKLNRPYPEAGDGGIGSFSLTQGRSSYQMVVIWKLVAAEIWRFCVMLCVVVLVQSSGSISIAIKWWLAPSANGATPCSGFWMNFCRRTINQHGNYWQFFWMDF